MGGLLSDHQWQFFQELLCLYLGQQTTAVLLIDLLLYPDMTREGNKDFCFKGILMVQFHDWYANKKALVSILTVGGVGGLVDTSRMLTRACPNNSPPPRDVPILHYFKTKVKGGFP